MKSLSGYQDKGSCQQTYNYRHSHASQGMENTLGLLACLFRVIRKLLLLKVGSAEIIRTTCIQLIIFREKTKHLNSPKDTFNNETWPWKRLIQGDKGIQFLNQANYFMFFWGEDPFFFNWYFFLLWWNTLHKFIYFIFYIMKRSILSFAILFFHFLTGSFNHCYSLQ